MSEEVKKRVSQRRSIISGSPENKSLFGLVRKALSRLTLSFSLPTLGYTQLM